MPGGNVSSVTVGTIQPRSKLQPRPVKKDDETHNQAVLLNIAGELGVLGQETVTFRGISITNCCRRGRIIVGRQKYADGRPEKEEAAGRNGMVLTRMDHLRAMLQSDLDNLVSSQISTYRGVLAPFANDVGFIGLCLKHHRSQLSNHLIFL